ncbi:hypothetical protein [Pseudomonas sp.]|uniref:hypothetical protein n=1 Tax=Pseudomonas sp. TaxID=306 RepID=UPI003C59EF51
MVITSDQVDAWQDAESERFDQPLSVWMYSNMCVYHKTNVGAGLLAKAVCQSKVQ